VKINIKYDKKAEELLSERLCNQSQTKPIWNELGLRDETPSSILSLQKQFMEDKNVKR